MTFLPEATLEHLRGVVDLSREIGRHLAGERVAAHAETLLERASRIAYRNRAWILLVAAYLLMRLILIFFFRT